jgi:hypothetical protein
MNPVSGRVNKAIRRQAQPDHNRAIHRESTARKFDILSELQQSPSSSLSLSSPVTSPISEEPPAIAQDAEVTYSFDAPVGPRGGSQLLGIALAKAVEKFETNETERIVNEEYEVLDELGESKPTNKKKGRSSDIKVKDLEDDFELV